MLEMDSLDFSCTIYARDTLAVLRDVLVENRGGARDRKLANVVLEAASRFDSAHRALQSKLVGVRKTFDAALLAAAQGADADRQTPTAKSECVGDAELADSPARGPQVRRIPCPVPLRDRLMLKSLRAEERRTRDILRNTLLEEVLKPGLPQYFERSIAGRDQQAADGGRKSGPWADAVAARQRRERGKGDLSDTETQWRSKDADTIMAYQRDQRWAISGLVMAEILEDAFCALTFGSGARKSEARGRAARGKGGNNLIVL